MEESTKKYGTCKKIKPIQNFVNKRNPNTHTTTYNAYRQQTINSSPIFFFIIIPFQPFSQPTNIICLTTDNQNKKRRGSIRSITSNAISTITGSKKHPTEALLSSPEDQPRRRTPRLPIPQIFHNAAQDPPPPPPPPVPAFQNPAAPPVFNQRFADFIIRNYQPQGPAFQRLNPRRRYNRDESEDVISTQEFEEFQRQQDAQQPAGGGMFSPHAVTRQELEARRRQQQEQSLPIDQPQRPQPQLPQHHPDRGPFTPNILTIQDFNQQHRPRPRQPPLQPIDIRERHRLHILQQQRQNQAQHNQALRQRANLNALIVERRLESPETASQKFRNNERLTLANIAR
ncbi:hypothetical protein B0T20DRAFT_265653 [Sordaria brevicollis]|uniref:Uncharacterized protein n=1 Tax=Sordaria brevicollis TaxID=83679 RepID=A0AAE0PA65_SORBR|nr:hypothetical protein B0T20DRAFT_265653 [Sordaria brevicollis]